MEPADAPTIEQILDNYGVCDMLDPNLYSQLLSELENRDNIMRTDAINYHISKGLDRVVQQY